MRPSETVHTFGRRHCLNRLSQLRQDYDRANAVDGCKDLTYGSRRAVLEAILVEVERLIPADFRSRTHATHRLVEVGQSAQNFMAQQKVFQKPPYVEAMQEERDRFANALHQFTAQTDWKNWNVEPLPYRRTLRYDESRDLLAQLRERWSITGKWWVPFEKYNLAYETMVLDSQAVREQLGYTVLRQIVGAGGSGHVYELWEHAREPNRELELALWEPASLWSERYWCSDDLNWLIYTTHDNSTTLAGDWMLQQIKATWPEWEAHLWAGLFE